jgi:hypothetical protein
MQFTYAAIVAALVSTAAAVNTMQFVNQDSTARTIYFTSNPGMETIEPLTINGTQTANQTFAEGWTGNFYSVSEGAVNKPGMLGEVAWNSWNGITFFDVSAIVDPTDVNGVKQIFPSEETETISGCESFPCAHVYVLPDDIQTKSTSTTSLVCLLGSAPVSTRRRGAVAEAARDIVVKRAAEIAQQL